jgi:hypothetical protein
VASCVREERADPLAAAPARPGEPPPLVWCDDVGWQAARARSGALAAPTGAEPSTPRTLQAAMRLARLAGVGSYWSRAEHAAHAARGFGTVLLSAHAASDGGASWTMARCRRRGGSAVLNSGIPPSVNGKVTIDSASTLGNAITAGFVAGVLDSAARSEAGLEKDLNRVPLEQGEHLPRLPGLPSHGCRQHAPRSLWRRSRFFGTRCSRFFRNHHLSTPFSSQKLWANTIALVMRSIFAIVITRVITHAVSGNGSAMAINTVVLWNAVVAFYVAVMMECNAIFVNDAASRTPHASGAARTGSRSAPTPAPGTPKASHISCAASGNPGTFSPLAVTAGSSCARRTAGSCCARRPAGPAAR